nr:hypothetical protein [Tanacetum cinerariifolium]
GSLCYPTNDYDDVGKLKAKANIGAPAVTISPSFSKSSPQDTSVHGIETPIDDVDSNVYEPYIAPEAVLEASSSIPVNADVAPNSPIAHVQMWTMDHPLDNVIGD